jgi:DNA invertase Pin-like site-specific DNA recombinase
MHLETQAQISALSYASVRSPHQIDHPDFVRQEVIVERFCRQREWRLIACLRDVEPRRVRTWVRPSLLYGIERINRGEAICLVTAELSRLCPSVAELGWILHAIEQAGGRLVALDPALDTGAPVGRAVARALLSVSDWERDRRAEQTSAARAKVALSGRISPELRRRIQELRGAGFTLQGIADLLNHEEVPTVRGGAHWRPSSVQTALGYRRPPSVAINGRAGSTRAGRRLVRNLA